MPFVCLAYAAGLIAIGVGFYFGTGSESWTALIPAFMGAPFVLCGALALNEKYLKHAMHAAAALAVIAFLATVNGVFGFLFWFTGGEVERPMAELSQGLTALLSVGFIAAAVNSFIQTRRAKKAAQAPVPDA